MNNWTEYKLSDLMQIKYGKDHKHLADGPFPLYGSGGIMRYVEKPLYSEASILIPRKGTLSNLFYLDKPFWSVDTMFYSIINKQLALPKYLYYTLKTFDLASLNVGSAVPSLTTEVLNDVLVSVPNIDTQTAIAEILSSLDDKIELNNKINQELENLAQTLFKQWFIDFEFPNENGEPYKSSGGEMVESELGEIPKGWEVKKLGELVKKSNTGADAIKRAPIVTEDTGIRCVRVGDMTNKRPFDEWGFCKITPEDYKRYKLEINDIVVTRTATLGINTIIRNEIKGVYNNGLIRLKIDSSKILPLLAYCFFQSDSYKIWIERISGDSSTRPNMQINYLLDFPMYQSPLNIQNRFIEQAEIIFESLESNILENKELTNLRDTLLPKLISGKLDVAEVME
jgi:type I restriction enzyme, S subunit